MGSGDFGERPAAARAADAVDRVSGFVGRTLGYAAVVLTVGLVFYEVIARYVFNAPTQFTLETGLILQIVIVASASAYVLREGGHVGIELVTERMAPRSRAAMGMVHAVIGFVFCALVCWQIWLSAAWSMKINKLTLDMELPLAPVQLFMIAGIALLALQFLVQGYRAWRTFRAPGVAKP